MLQQWTFRGLVIGPNGNQAAGVTVQIAATFANDDGSLSDVVLLEYGATDSNGLYAIPTSAETLLSASVNVVGLPLHPGCNGVRQMVGPNVEMNPVFVMGGLQPFNSWTLNGTVKNAINGNALRNYAFGCYFTYRNINGNQRYHDTKALVSDDNGNFNQVVQGSIVQLQGVQAMDAVLCAVRLPDVSVGGSKIINPPSQANPDNTFGSGSLVVLSNLVVERFKDL